MDTNKKTEKFFFTIIVGCIGVIVIATITLVLFIKKSGGEKQLRLKNSAANTKILQDTMKGMLKIEAKEKRKTYTKGEVVYVMVKASSQGIPVFGYDAVLAYNKKNLAFLGYKNLNTDFQTVLKKQEGVVDITGVKQLTVRTSSIFESTPLLEIAFSSLTTGASRIDFDFIPKGTKDSNLVDENSNDILGRVEGIAVEVIQ